MPANPFVGDIAAFPYSFTPAGWAVCDGSTITAAQNSALVFLLAGAGATSATLPDLRGVTPLHPGTGPGLSTHVRGETGGAATVALIESEMPAHTHSVAASGSLADLATPGPARVLARSAGGPVYRADPGAAGRVPMAPQSLKAAGTGAAHNNLQPYLVMRFCIATQGVFPQS